MTSPPTEKLPRSPALDGLRGIAILAVLLTHAIHAPNATGPVAWLAAVATYGWLGVDLFFVLSGFLITSILLRTPPNGAALRNFYVRRALRTWPLFYPCLLLAFCVFPFLPPYLSADLHHAIRNQLWYEFHACNIYFAIQHNWSAGFLDHFWSLAVEEQFYLLWPLLVLPLRARLVPWACAVLIPAAALLRIALVLSGQGYIRTRVLLPDNLDSLLLGAVVAVIHHRWPTALPTAAALPKTTSRPRLIAWALLLLSATYALACIATNTFPGLAFNAFVQPAAVLAFAAATYLLLSPGPLATATLARGALPFLGRYAYGLYVLHIFLRPLFELAGTPSAWALRLGPSAGCLAYAAIMILGSLAVAIPTYHLWELRWLRMKSRFA